MSWTTGTSPTIPKSAPNPNQEFSLVRGSNGCPGFQWRVFPLTDVPNLNFFKHALRLLMGQDIGEERSERIQTKAPPHALEKQPETRSPLVASNRTRFTQHTRNSTPAWKQPHKDRLSGTSLDLSTIWQDSPNANQTATSPFCSYHWVFSRSKRSNFSSMPVSHVVAMIASLETQVGHFTSSRIWRGFDSKPRGHSYVSSPRM